MLILFLEHIKAVLYKKCTSLVIAKDVTFQFSSAAPKQRASYYFQVSPLALKEYTPQPHDLITLSDGVSVKMDSFKPTPPHTMVTYCSNLKVLFYREHNFKYKASTYPSTVKELTTVK